MLLVNTPVKILKGLQSHYDVTIESAISYNNELLLLVITLRNHKYYR